MTTVKMSLCPACTACPEVEIAEDEVWIGEAGNLVTLKKDESNVLVDLIQWQRRRRRDRHDPRLGLCYADCDGC